MMINMKVLLIPFLLCVTTALFPGGKSEKKNTVQITGTVRLVGAEPFTELVIRAPDGDWIIAGEDRAKLHDLQYCLVTVEGIPEETELKFASGRPAGKRRELKKIKLIGIHQAE
jgi:hypothetical protein